MKLKTRIDGTVGDYFLVINGDSDMHGEDQLEHDAAAAHALMQAIGEFHNAPLDSSLTFPKDAIDWLGVRADEIMAGWGFDSGEDA